METEQIEQLYGQIANQLNKMIPVKWNKILLYSEVTELSNRTYFYFYSSDGGEPVYSLDIEDLYQVDESDFEKKRYELNDFLNTLWQLFINNKQLPWTNLTYELHSNGEFDIEYDYNKLDESDDYEQRVIWKYEKLGVLPNENRKRDVQIIEEYKKEKFS